MKVVDLVYAMEVINVMLFLLLLRKSVCENEQCNNEDILLAKIPNKNFLESELFHIVKVDKAAENCFGICRIKIVLQ